MSSSLSLEASSYIEFSVSKVHLPDAVWIHDEFQLSSGPVSSREFSELFSYMTPYGERFSNLRFECTAEKIYLAERYGGYGVGENGGGVRCGNYLGYQIKGIGKNPLVGPETSQWHSYGGLNAKDAIHEAIYAQVLNMIMPLGCAKIFGVILTSSDGAYYEVTEFASGREVIGWGALLIREICIRPGHYVRTPLYVPRKDQGLRISADVIRVRNANKHLLYQFNGIHNLQNHIRCFIDGCANQLGFSKMARITHGAISSSNVCFDGRWIDLTNTSFIGGGQNIGGLTTFNEEQFIIPSILSEFIDTFSKYTGIWIDKKSAISYYHKKLGYWYTRHVSYLLGLEIENLDGVDEKHINYLTEISLKILNSGKFSHNNWPTHLSDADIILQYQIGLFYSLAGMDQDSLNVLTKVCDQVALDKDRLLVSINAIYASVVQKSALMSRGALIKKHCMHALKRTIFSEYFFKGRLELAISEHLNRSPFTVGNLINDSIFMAKWIYESSSDDMINIYKYGGVVISFSSAKNVYCLDINGDSLYTEKSSQLIAVLKDLDDDLFLVNLYDFRKWVIYILQFIDNIEKGIYES